MLQKKSPTCLPGMTKNNVKLTKLWARAKLIAVCLFLIGVAVFLTYMAILGFAPAH